MDKKLAGLIAGLVLGSCGMAVQANLLDDAGFEAATSGSQISNSDWILDINFPDGADPAAEFREASWASYPAADAGTGVWFRSFEGEQAPGDPAAQAHLYQTVVAQVAGDYALSFFAKKETSFTATNWTATLSSDGSGGSDIFELLAAAPADGSWNQYNLNLSGVSLGDLLTVSVLMVDGIDSMINPQSAFVDAFDLESAQSVPTPATLALFGLGLAGLGWSRRKKT